MNTDKIYPSKYLKAGDVGEVPVSYTITQATLEEVGQDKEDKLVLYFKGEEKGFVVNKTNTNTIAKVLDTKETDEWIGKAIRLYSTEVAFQGEMVEAIRVSLKPGVADNSKPGTRSAKTTIKEAQAINSMHETPSEEPEEDNIPY